MSFIPLTARSSCRARAYGRDRRPGQPVFTPSASRGHARARRGISRAAGVLNPGPGCAWPPSISAKCRVGLAVSDELGCLPTRAGPRRAETARSCSRALASWRERRASSGSWWGSRSNWRGEDGGAARARASSPRRSPTPRASRSSWSTSASRRSRRRRRLREGGYRRAARAPRIDGAAAAVLLQAWLDARPSRGP